MVRYSRVMEDDPALLPHDVDTDRQRFPHAVVWTPLPLLSWLFPLIGHTGICTTEGVINDFAGPYTVTVDNMAFGDPTKYWQLDLSKVGDVEWDEAVTKASQEYRNRMHNLCCDNCHSHVAYAMNLMKYDGKSNWNMVHIAIYLLIYGKYTGFGGFLKTWLPFILVVAVILIVIFVF